MQEGRIIDTAMIAAGWPHAHDFFKHYLDGSGADLDFDSTTAYHDATGFSSAVDSTVKQLINQSSGQGIFDSGWIDFPPVGTSTSAWNNDDWKNAIGHGFYRVTGQRQQDGTWTVRLQLTSYYQFRPGGDFTAGPVIVKGADMRHLEQIGWARNFRSIGTGTLTYDGQGNPRN